MTKLQAICLIGLILAAGVICLVIDRQKEQEVSPPSKFTQVPYVTTSWTKEAYMPKFEVEDIVNECLRGIIKEKLDNVESTELSSKKYIGLQSVTEGGD